MSDNFFFPVFTGLLTEEHVEKIGPALWEFLWLIAKTTKETAENGEILALFSAEDPLKTWK